MSKHLVDPKLKKVLSILLEVAGGDYEKLPTTAADHMAEQFIRTYRLVSLKPGQIVVGPEPDAWTDPDDVQRIKDGLHAGLHPHREWYSRTPVYFGTPQGADDE